MKVINKTNSLTDRPLFICDFSPPRGADISVFEQARNLSADFICIAYNPGHSVRVDSTVMAYMIKNRTGKEVIFNLATRDMNKLALQTHLLGAQLLGLENVVILRGDEFNVQDQSKLKMVHDFTPTDLIHAINSMNQGLDFRKRKLNMPTDFCIGATIDLTNNIHSEAHLTQNKLMSGTHFFITQPIYNVSEITAYHKAYQEVSGSDLDCPVFYGLQILQKNSSAFGNIPNSILNDLNAGRSGSEIAIELLHQFISEGIKGIYLVPPILKGGVRDYEAAQRVLSEFE